MGLSSLLLHREAKATFVLEERGGGRGGLWLKGILFLGSRSPFGPNTAGTWQA